MWVAKRGLKESGYSFELQCNAGAAAQFPSESSFLSVDRPSKLPKEFTGRIFLYVDASSY